MQPALIVVLALLSACATSRPHNDSFQSNSSSSTAYVINDQTTNLSRFAPIFISAQTDQSFNRIGQPFAQLDNNGNEVIAVDAKQSYTYVDQQPFSTNNGRYTNLIYRVHFEKTPFRLFPFHITAGNNNGLLAVITLDAKNRPILVTTVHTCGCFLAIVPTSYLPAAAYPDGWNLTSQSNYGMTLPGLLNFPIESDDQQRIAIYLKEETHRVMDIQLQTQTEIASRFNIETLNIAPIADLMKLPLSNGTTTPFFEIEGSRKGYVKGSHKPFERLMISWWAFDWRVGEDKAYGDKHKTGAVFYTSLKPWNRQNSDMWPFGEFLDFWGWRL